MTDKRYPVIEIFGPTIQGEGALAGKVTQFVRFGGCDYRCAWCDSSYAVLPEEVRKHAEKLTADEIVERVVALDGKPDWVTLSGGNPALHQLDLLVDSLHDCKFKVAVETQGSLWKDWLINVDQLTVSPKPPSSRMYTAKNMDQLYNFMDQYWEKEQLTPICFKIPVYDEQDYDMAVETHAAFLGIPFYLSVVTEMGGLYGDFAEGRKDTRDTLLERTRWLYERVSADGLMGDITVIPQLHALVWGHGRGF